MLENNPNANTSANGKASPNVNLLSLIIFSLDPPDPRSLETNLFQP